MQRLQQPHGYARIRVVGIGGGGITAVNRMINDRVFGVEYITVDTDPISKKETNAPKHIQLRSGFALNQGANGDAPACRQAAFTPDSDLQESFEGSDIVFILAGLGGGTGSGAAPEYYGQQQHEQECGHRPPGCGAATASAPATTLVLVGQGVGAGGNVAAGG